MSIKQQKYFYFCFIGELFNTTDGQMVLFKHDTQWGPIGRHIVCPNPTNM